VTAPLTVPEARVVLRADEALDLTYETRLAAGTTFNDEERETWMALVSSAHDRIVAYEGTHRAPQEFVVEPYPGGNMPDFQTICMEAVAAKRVESRTGYTIKRLTTDDAAELAELLRVSIDDKHLLAWHPRLREIREKMIERMGDIADQRSAP
jgi:hypothetical protein